MAAATERSLSSDACGENQPGTRLGVVGVSERPDAEGCKGQADDDPPTRNRRGATSLKGTCSGASRPLPIGSATVRFIHGEIEVLSAAASPAAVVLFLKKLLPLWGQCQPLLLFLVDLLMYVGMPVGILVVRSQDALLVRHADVVATAAGDAVAIVFMIGIR